jgi:ubiquinone biosynthesis protein
MFALPNDIWRLVRATRILAKYRTYFGADAQSTTVSDKAAQRLRSDLERLGPAYIKLGQVLATRPDIIGPEFAAALESLQDRVPPFPQDTAMAELQDAFGVPAGTLYAKFGNAVAAASIAQVHQAETADETPRLVAVKILRPGIEHEFASELSAMRRAAKIAQRLSREARRLRLVEIIETLARSVALELDLRMEAAAASELAESNRQNLRFRVPEVDWQRTTARVLTTEWIDGVSLRDPQALADAGHDPAEIARLLIRTFLDQSLRDGFFHADMHPGNLFIDSEGRLVAVDFGIMGRLDPAMRRFMAETLAGFLARDYRRVADVHFAAGFVPRSHAPETFAQALRAIGEPIFGRTARDVSMARLLQQLFDTTRRFDMEAQPQLVLLQKTMVVVEGVARSLDPHFDIWEASRPVVERWMIDSMGPQAQLRDAAEGVSALGRLARELPVIVRNAELVSSMLAQGGLRLHSDTAQQIARLQAAQTRFIPVSVALSIVAVTLAAIALL